MNNEKWLFLQLPGLSLLSYQEVKYWKNNLKKVLKIGLEFEFNLPNNKGSCRGSSVDCPCIHFENNDCWTECILEDNCKKEFGDKFKEVCSKELCSNFSMKCSKCDKFQLDCEGCKFMYNKEKDPDSIRQYLRDQMDPTGSYGHINKSGVHSVVCDGSLVGEGEEGKGAEVITVGRRVDYWEFYKMTKNIIEKAVNKGAYVNERCSIHIHLLAAYYKKITGMYSNKEASFEDSASELEKSIPGIVLYNFHQLCRKYQNAMTWLTMGLDTPEHMTRWEKFRVSILDISPIKSSMRGVISSIEKKSSKKNGKYGWVNYMFTEFDKNEDIKRFHVEVRPMDCLLSASAVTSMSCLIYSLLIKAVEISKYGVVHIENDDWIHKSLQIKNKILNNTSDWNETNRFSDTSKLTHKDMDYLTKESLELIGQTKHILYQLGPAYEVLEKLAYKPAALRRCEGQTWPEIEKDLEVYIHEETKLEHNITELIDLRKVMKCSSEEQWTVKIVDLLKENDDSDKLDNLETSVKEILGLRKENGELIWSSHLGSMLMI